MEKIVTIPQSVLSEEDILQAVKLSLEDKKDLKKVLLVPPDISRLYSGANTILRAYYNLLHDSCHIDIIPAIGTHDIMTKEEFHTFFGDDIPFESAIHHNWETEIQKVGTVPGDFVEAVSDGIMCNDIDVEINRALLDPSYDLIISIGQVVPHAVVGMANYSKNIFVGCGGSTMIDNSHMLGAFYGMERILGKANTPVRDIFHYAEENFIADLPIMYVLTVMSMDDDTPCMDGLFIGRGRDLFNDAAALALEKNITLLDKPLKKVVAYLDEQEFKSTWLGNKAIYRTRMAIADGGELIVLAPGVRKCGEDDKIDEIIKKYGYTGREKFIELSKTNDDLKNRLAACAHLIHGSTDDRFNVTYAVNHLTKEEVEGIGYNYIDYNSAIEIYDPSKLQDGVNIMPNGEEIYYISKPTTGLWALRNKFED